jgi:antitoxin VapB
MPTADDRSNPLRAKLFLNGRSQAVRLPKAFRFEGADEVEIRREGDAVILTPVRRTEWPEGFLKGLVRDAPLFANLKVPAPLPAGGTDVHFDPE